MTIQSEHRHLDLRSERAQQRSLNPSKGSRSTGSGTDRHGRSWTVEGHQSDGRGTLIIVNLSVHHPDGRVLHLTASGESGSTTAAAFGHVLGGNTSALFHKTDRNVRARTHAAEDLARLFDTAWPYATVDERVRDDGPDVHDRLQAAAFDMPYEQVGLIREQILSTVPWTLARAEVGRIETYVPVRYCALLYRNTITARQAWDTLGNHHRWTDKAVASAAALVHAGWQPEQIRTLHADLNLTAFQYVHASWALFSPKEAFLLVRAGISPAEAIRARRAGTLDLDGLAALAALRGAGLTLDLTAA